MPFQKFVALVSLSMFAMPVRAEPPPATLTLRQAEEIAITQRPLLRSGELATVSARQNTFYAESARFPQLSANITAVDAYREETTQNGKDVTLDTRIAAGGLNNPTILRREAGGLSLSQLIADFGRTSSLVESAKLSEAAQLHQLHATRSQVLLEVIDAFYSVLGAQAVLVVASKTIDERKLLLDKIALLAKNKMKSELDVTFARINFEEARLLMLKAENSLEAAFSRLSTSLGYRDNRHFILQGESNQSEPPKELEVMLEQALRARPELLGLRSEQEAAMKSADAASALRYPTISAFAAGGTTVRGDDRLSRYYGAIGVNLNMTFLDGGKISSLQQQAQLRAMAMKENLTEAENSVVKNVRTAWLNARSSYESIDITSQLKNAASEAFKLAEARYNLGLTSIVELNQAQLSAVGAEIANGRARYEYQIARAVLDYQVGSLELVSIAH